MSEQAPPPSAFQFLASAQFDAPAEGKNRRFSGVAYGGGVITDHPYWDRVVFDLSDARAQSAKVPILLDHDSHQRAGFAAISIADKITADGELLPNTFGASIAADADAGFPWQMSLGVFPSRIDELQAGQSETINGREVTGPAHIFRGSRFREVSFVALGADAETSASVFAGRIKPPTEGESMSDTKGPEARIAELEASAAESKATIESITAERDKAVADLASFAASKRETEVKGLFESIGRKFSDEEAKPYMEMPETTFAAVAKDLKAAKPAVPAHLFSEQATDGEGGKPADPQVIARKAREFQAAAKARGEFVSISDACRAVSATTSTEG